MSARWPKPRHRPSDRRLRFPKLIVPASMMADWGGHGRTAIIRFADSGADSGASGVRWIEPPPWPKGLHRRSTMSLRSFRKLVKR